MGLDPESEQARRAVALVHENSRWEHDNEPFFSGEVEPCINGLAVSLGAYFRRNVQAIVDRLLTEQLGDGGWNCEVERGSTRSSFGTTIDVLEGLLEHERATGGTADARDARHRAEEYLMERRMFRRLSTGEVADETWTLFSYPTYYYYDVLRGLDYLRTAGVAPDKRVAEAIGLVEKRRGEDGRWPLQNPHPASSTSLWMRAREGPVGGTPYARCGCSAGTSELIRKDGDVPTTRSDAPAPRLHSISFY